MTSVSKNMCIDNLADKINKYNTYHSTIKMKLADVKSSGYTDLNKENNRQDPEFEFGGHVKISKYKNWSEEAFVIKEVKNTVP